MPRFPSPAAVVVPLLAACGGGDPARPTNLLVVTVDTLRADHLGAYGYERPTSPAIDALADESVVFDEAWATTSWTLPSLASAMTSLYPSAHGAVSDGTKLRDEFTTLAERFGEAGFHTGGITSHIFLSRRFGLHQGFADYDEELVFAYQERKKSHLAISSPRLTEKAEAWLEARAAEGTARPWFLWLHYFDPHNKYRAHDGVSEAFGTEQPIDLYDGEIAFTDAHVGRVLAKLDELGFADDTAVVFMADHGEEFGDHGGIFHRRSLYQEVLRVPWMMRVPGVAPRRVGEPVSLVDLAPTVYELFDLAPPPGLLGRSLVPLLRGESLDPRQLVAELDDSKYVFDAIRDGRWKFVVDPRNYSYELYDLERDPAEQRDVAKENPEICAALLMALEERLAEAELAAEAITSDAAAELTQSDLRTIDDLGYGGADAAEDGSEDRPGDRPRDNGE